MNKTNKLALSLVVASFCFVVKAADVKPRETNYDEAKVPAYTLPDPLTFTDGKKVTSARQWRKRREEILELYRTHVFGHSPTRPRGMKFEVTALDKTALGGMATRKEVAVYLTGKADGPRMDILMYLPNDVQKPSPAFLSLNFKGNHAISADPGISLSTRWAREFDKGDAIVNNRATEASRGKEANRYPLEMILKRGYAVATIYCGDIEPDHAEGWKDGARAKLSPNDWSAIGAWAWGMSRAMDYLETDRTIDAKRVAVMGHSRLGKTTLWAGAQDERFALVISNNSGEGGAAITRRCFGENIAHLNKNFPHWFCGNFKKYNDKENDLPVDAHMLLALVAPRPLYVASAEEDRWADPRGEFLACKHADPVYRLLGLAGLGVKEMPAVNQPVGQTIGYHIRTGKHEVTDYDWEQYLAFADRHLAKAKKH